MTGRQLQKLVDSCDLSQRGAARALEIHERTMRRHVVSDRVPKLVELAMLHLQNVHIGADFNRQIAILAAKGRMST
jgi:predicted DNA-binding protein (UPF0251 family)